jgi:succinate dehydrogenase hydrophobic anchor subunit
VTEARIWFLQRLAGLLLIPLIMFHLLHKAGVLGAWADLSVRYVAALALLFCLLFHGLYGLRTVIYDYVRNTELLRWTDRLILACGLFLLLYGGWGLWVFSRR